MAHLSLALPKVSVTLQLEFARVSQDSSVLRVNSHAPGLVQVKCAAFVDRARSPGHVNVKAATVVTTAKLSVPVAPRHLAACAERAPLQGRAIVPFRPLQVSGLGPSASLASQVLEVATAH
jgi:hypothetical protein